MKIFRTIVEIPQFPWKIDYQKYSLFMGSCFVENIGGIMLEYKYNVDLNPFGILYNPISVANSLNILIKGKTFTSDDLVSSDGLWHSFNHHSRFSFTKHVDTLNAINKRIQISSDNLKTADFLFITFGTSWVYQLKSSGEIVSNCHKIPAKEFNRYRLSVNEIVEEYKSLVIQLAKVNPKLKIIFTVSPIRHRKDGAVENQLSKATLLLAIQKLIEDLGKDFCAYFPSYEIVMDELRDYRFYTEDMIHISKTGIDYIWDRFEFALISGDSQKLAIEIGKLRKATEHRPFNPNTPEHIKFLKSNLKKAQELVAKFPYLNLMEEMDFFTRQIGIL